METARCRAVLAAAETGSFSKAAEVLLLHTIGGKPTGHGPGK